MILKKIILWIFLVFVFVFVGCKTTNQLYGNWYSTETDKIYLLILNQGSERIEFEKVIVNSNSENKDGKEYSYKISLCSGQIAVLSLDDDFGVSDACFLPVSVKIKIGEKIISVPGFPAIPSVFLKKFESCKKP